MYHETFSIQKSIQILFPKPFTNIKTLPYFFPCESLNSGLAGFEAKNNTE